MFWKHVIYLNVWIYVKYIKFTNSNIETNNI